MVPFAEENAVGTQAAAYEARVLDEDALKADDFIERERVLAGLQDRAAPSLQPVARRPFALDLEAGPAVGQQHEAGGARNQMGAGAAHGFPRLGGEVERQKFRERLGAPDDRAEPAGAQEIVAHAMPLRDRRGLPVKYASGSRRSMAAALGASSTSRVRPVRVS